MNRDQFMRELERLLSDLPDSERTEALQYYNDYFDDAGAENEAQIIAELGSPEKVARTIREGMSEESSEYTENGYADTRYQEHQGMSAGPGNPTSADGSSRPRSGNGWKLLSIILLALLLSPILLPLGIAAFAVVCGIIVGIIGICIGVVAAGGALLVAGVMVIGYGIFRLFLTPAIGLGIGGIGCLLLAVGILITMAVIWLGVHLIPGIIRGIVAVLRYPFRKAGERR